MFKKFYRQTNVVARGPLGSQVCQVFITPCWLKLCDINRYGGGITLMFNTIKKSMWNMKKAFTYVRKYCFPSYVRTLYGPRTFICIRSTEAQTRSYYLRERKNLASSFSLFFLFSGWEGEILKKNFPWHLCPSLVWQLLMLVFISIH